MRRLRPGILVAAAAACALALTGCGQQQEKPKRLTTDQAQSLAIMRFKNYDQRRLNTTISADTASLKFRAKALLDMRRHVGYAEYTTADPDSGATINKGMLAWSMNYIETAEGGDFRSPPPATAWTERSLSSASPVDILLVLALQLGADRPENPALLQQSGARLLRTEHRKGKTTYVIAGPGSSAADTTSPTAGATAGATAGPTAQASTTSSRTTYWIGKSGQLSKFVADLGGSPATITVVGADGFPAAIPKAVYRYLRMKG